MNKNIFRRISIITVASLTLLTIVQCLWIYNLYNDQKGDFKHRVETAAYKSMYGAFALNSVPEDGQVHQINIDLSTFALYFEINLGELEIYQPFVAEVIDMDADRVMMRYSTPTDTGKGLADNSDAFKNAHTFQMPIDDDNTFSLRISICFPMGEFIKSIWLLLTTSVMIVVLLSLVMVWMVKVLFRQKTLEDMRRDFTNNMTHELKTPISVASAAVDALRNFSAGADPERRARYLQMTDTALKQLAAMVEKILAIAVEGRQAKLNKEQINISELLRETAAEAQLNISGGNNISGGAGISVGAKCDENIFIEADRFHLKNVIATLLDNAVKYAPAADGREIEICVSAKRRGGEVVIAVADNGCGIAKEHLPHIFEKFYRVPKGDVHQVRGYGLGLAYAQKIVTEHGGRISAESRVGKGTVITIIFNK